MNTEPTQKSAKSKNQRESAVQTKEGPSSETLVKEGYKHTKLGWIPSDWDLKKLGEITKTMAGGTPSTSREEYWGGNIKWMSSGELNLKKYMMLKGELQKRGSETPAPN